MKTYRKSPSHIEDNHQEMLFTWAKYAKVALPNGEAIKLSDALYAIPNGGKRDKREAVRLKRQGVKAGVSDTHLPIASNGFHGLWIELKRPIVKGESKPTVQSSQISWIVTVETLGHKGVIAYGYEQAKKAIIDYLGSMLITK